MTTRAEQKEKRRGEILVTALDVFIRKGYAGTKVSDIAKAAGMSTGLLFHYYESKEKLYETLIEIGISGPESLLGELVDCEPLEYFEQAAEQILGMLVEMPFVAKMFVLMNHAYYSEGIPRRAKEMAVTTDFYRRSVPIILAGQEEGTIRSGDPFALSIAYWSAIQGAAEVIGLNPDMPASDSEWIVDIIRRK